MKLIMKAILFAGLCGVLLSAHLPALAADNFNLKPGGRGEVCLTCHVTIKEKMQKPFVHTPLKKGECVGCHSPHASDHERLLSGEISTICLKCHTSLVAKNAVSVHQVVTEGKCVLCHDPHAADNKFNLLKGGKELCFGCHQEFGAKVGANSVKHPPVESSCVKCHSPHASATNPKLLINGMPGLCLSCHNAENPAFKKKHLDYPVTKSRCTSCHNPHGSNAKGMLWDNVHKPVQNKMCDQCHVGANSSPPFALKQTGYLLCQQCHSQVITEVLSKDRLHWPLLDKKGCVNCHSPHASSEEKLLKAPMVKLCGSCHADTIARQERSQTKHPPANEGKCMECHMPHSSDNAFLWTKPAVIDVCAKCHEWQTHSTHPIGKEKVDPRNPNLTLSCQSCHRAHGTEYKHFIYTEDVKDLCVQCHANLRR